MAKQEVFEQQQRELATRSTRPLQQKSGLFLAELPDQMGRTAGEELFRSNLAERIPVVGSIVKGSNRAFTGYLNRLRADAFDSTAEAWMKAGIRPEARPEVYEALAGWINNASGRGDLGKLEKFAPVLEQAIAAPHFQASRLKIMNPTYCLKMPKEVRALAMRDVAVHAGAAVSLLTLAKLGGAEVEMDPRSTDFGKIKIGKTRVDILGGFQPWVRFYAEVATQRHKTASGKEIIAPRFPTRNLDGSITPGVIADRGRQIAHPSLSYLIDAWQGEDIAGRPFDPKDSAVRRVAPLMWQDMTEAIAEHGGAGLGFAPGAALGAGVTTYQDKPKRAENAAIGPKPAPTPIPFSVEVPGAEELLTINPELLYGTGKGARMKGIDPREGAVLRGMTPNSEALTKPPPPPRPPLSRSEIARRQRKYLKNLKKPPAVENETITYPSRP